MAIYTIKNVSTNSVYLSDFFAEIPANGEITVDRAHSDLPNLPSLQRALAAGSVTVVVKPSAAELVSGALTSGQVLNAAKTVYVDATLGSDTTGTGDAESPFKTLAVAVKVIPERVNFPITFKLAPGTYPGRSVISCDVAHQGNIVIEGTGWSTPTLTSGLTTCTIASGVDGALNVTDAGWTVNELRGKFAKFTSGPISGRVLPIISNTASSIAIPMNSVGLTGTFDIATPGAILENGTGFHIIDANLSQYDTSTPAVTIKSVHLNATGAYGINLRGGSLTLNSTSMVTQAGCWYGVFSDSPTAVVGSRDSSIVLGAGGAIPFYLLRAAAAEFSSTYIRGLSQGSPSSGYGIYAEDVGRVNIQPGTHFPSGTYKLVVDNFPSGIDMRSGTLYAKAFTVQNCNYGVVLAFTNFEADGLVLSGNIGTGMVLGDNCSVDLIGGLTATANLDGIRVAGNDCHITIGAGVVTSNTGWGINLAYGGVRACYNSVVFTSAATMSGNTSGDMTLDGTTATAYADLTGDADKAIVDAVRFNRLAHA